MKKQNMSLAFILGAVAGGVAMLFMPSDKQKKGKKIIEDKASQVKKGLIELYDREEVQSIFGMDSEVVGKNLVQARKQVAAQLKTLKTKVDAVDKTQYVALVNRVIASIEKQGELTKMQLKKLEKHLNDQYDKPEKK
jgi:hypothetical protein